MGDPTLGAIKVAQEGTLSTRQDPHKFATTVDSPTILPSTAGLHRKRDLTRKVISPSVMQMWLISMMLLSLKHMTKSMIPGIITGMAHGI